MNLQVKRIIVGVVSLAIGVALTALTIFVLFGTTLRDFAYSNVVLLFLSTASIAAIWLDYALGAEILKQ